MVYRSKVVSSNLTINITNSSSYVTARATTHSITGVAQRKSA